MEINNIYAMSNEALAREVGRRIDKIRLEQNLSQQEVAESVGITAKTYRMLVQGGGKFETMVAVLRVLGQLELVETFIPETTFSPLELVKLKGQERQRASRKKEGPEADGDQTEEIDW
jgi:transcriptional regulator with XRE-family HTH domain